MQECKGPKKSNWPAAPSPSWNGTSRDSRQLLTRAHVCPLHDPLAAHLTGAVDHLHAPCRLRSRHKAPGVLHFSIGDRASVFFWHGSRAWAVPPELSPYSPAVAVAWGMSAGTGCRPGKRHSLTVPSDCLLNSHSYANPDCPATIGKSGLAAGVLGDAFQSIGPAVRPGHGNLVLTMDCHRQTGISHFCFNPACVAAGSAPPRPDQDCPAAAVQSSMRISRQQGRPRSIPRLRLRVRNPPPASPCSMRSQDGSAFRSGRNQCLPDPTGSRQFRQALFRCPGCHGGAP